MYGALLVVDAERMVAGWVLEERLGSGGFGEVWRARRRHLDLRRALKLIPILSEGAFESWRHEISRLEELSHPNVVRFYDADIVSEGPYRDHAWIATELCDRSLADELRRRDRPHLSPAECEQLLDGMLAALAAAYTAGCVHRDVKPANILRHASGAWKLADFGTARLVPIGATHPVTQVIGTLPYMSPAAHHGQQNHAADLYALGVIVQESLCGRRLHHRAEHMTDSEYLKFVLDNPPVVSDELPPRWQTVVETLIGRHGVQDAVQLGAWFRATHGAHPPPSRNGSTPPPNGLTGPTELGAAPSANSRAVALRPPPPSPPAPAPPAPSPPPPRVLVPAPERPLPPAARRPAAPTPPAPRPGPPPPSAAPTRLAPRMLARRIGAGLVDIVFVFLVGGILGVVTAAMRYDQIRVSDRPDPNDPCAEVEDEFVDCEVLGDFVYVTGEQTEMWLRQGTTAGTAVLVFVVLQGMSGRTPGKLAFGLRVVGPTGRRPGMRRALLRTVMWVVDGVPYVVPLLALLVSAARKDNRRVGDVVAGTYVIRTGVVRAGSSAA